MDQFCPDTENSPYTKYVQCNARPTWPQDYKTFFIIESLKVKKIIIFPHFTFYKQLKFHAQLSLAW